jgi:ABC-2 type transport system permease protein
LKTVWYIAKKDLLQIFKDRTAFIILLAVPLILILIVGFALGSLLGNSSGKVTIKVAVSNQDNGYVGKAVVDALNVNNSQLAINLNRYGDSARVSKDVANSNVDAGVVIPAGTTDALVAASTNGTPSQNLVKFYALPNSTQATVTLTQQIVTSVVDQLVIAQYAGSTAVKQVNSVCNQPGNHCEPATINAQTVAQIVGQASTNATKAAQVEVLTTGQAFKVGTFDLAVPGYAIFFSLFSINAAAATILQEKEDGTFRRLLIAPVQKYALLGGKLLAQFLLTLLQLLVLFAVGYLVFHIHIGSWPAVILLLIGSSFAATGLGILLVSAVKTRRQLNPIVTLVTLVTSAIGGAWWPLFIEPTWMQNIAKLGITAWAIEGLNGVMIFGKSFTDVVPDILGLFAYGLIAFLIAMRFFRFQERVA